MAIRITLFILTNLAIMLILSLSTQLLGLTHSPDDLVSLFIFSFIMGSTGSIISLFLSKKIALSSLKGYLITTPQNSTEVWLVATVQELATKAGIGVPDIAIFDDMSPNAFATGAFRDHALVAVSTGLLKVMDENEVKAVLGHEIGHIANGDMITLSLLQGIINTFVIFFARIIGFVVDTLLSKGQQRSNQTGPAYMIATFIAEIVLSFLGTLIVMAFSRYREYRADHAGATLAGRTSMIRALQTLMDTHETRSSLPDSLKAFGISGSMRSLFSTHPPLSDRIARLQNYVS